MVFQELYKEKRISLLPHFEKLFEEAKINQPHSSELSLILFNGYYEPNLITNKNISFKPSAYQTGFERSTLSEITHTEFIDSYLFNNNYKSNLEGFNSEIEQLSTGDKEDYNKLMKVERVSVQQEMLIYLKIWESTQFIKECYQFIEIIDGKPFNWKFKLKSSSSDPEGIATASYMIKKIITKRLKPLSIEIYNEFKNSYDTELRNSIAHSKYHIQGRNIILNNSKYKEGQIQFLGFEEWIERFHSSLVLFKAFSWLRYKIRMHYIGLALKQDNKIEYCINKEDGSKEYRLMEYHPEFDKWTKD